MKTENMNKAQKRTDIILSANIATWEMRMEGAYTGTFSGTFRFRCFLSPTQRIAIGREQRDLLGPMANLAPNDETMFVVMLTELKYRILEAPPFWAAASGSGYQGDILDENVLTEVFAAALDADLKYRAVIMDGKMKFIEKAKIAAEAIASARDEAASIAEPKAEEEEIF